MTRQTYRQRLLLLLCSLLFASSCTCDQIWQPPTSSRQTCDPNTTEFFNTKDGQTLSSLLKTQTEGVPVCLQLGLGSARVTSAQSQLLLLKQDGELQTLDQKGSPTFVLPRGSGTKKKRFRLFVFSPQFQGSKQLYCNGAMRAPAYDCLGATQNGTCLAYFEFRPQSPDDKSDGGQTNPIASAPDMACRLHIRKMTLEPVKETAPDTTEDTPDTKEDIPEPPQDNVLEPLADTGSEPIQETKPQDLATCANQNCAWFNIAGGAGSDRIHAVHHAKNGNIIVAGTLNSTNPAFGNLSTPTLYGKMDIFVGKLDRAGNWLWVRTAGSAEDDQCWSMAVSPQGDIYIGGHITEKATFGTFVLDPPKDKSRPRDIFVAKLTTDGVWQWVVRSQSSGNDHVTSMFVEPGGDLLVAGIHQAELILDKRHTSSSKSTNWIARVSSQGSWVWSNSFKTNLPVLTEIATQEKGPIIAYHPAGKGTILLVSEIGQRADIGPYSLTNNSGNIDSFIAQMDLQGKWRSLLQFTSKGRESTGAIDVALNGDIIIVGRYTTQITFGPYVLDSGGHSNNFIAAININNQWQWARNVDALENGCKPLSVAASQQGEIYVAGTMANKDCQLDALTLKAENNSQRLFVAKLDAQRKWTWAIKGGGTYPGQPLLIQQIFLSLNANDELAIAGAIFQTTFGTYTSTTLHRDLQLFIARNINR